MKNYNAFNTAFAALSFAMLLFVAQPNLAATTCSYAANGSTITGTVKYISIYNGVNNYTPETTGFTLSTMPTAISAATYQYFAISPNTVADAQTRKNFLALIYLAKATGGQIEVAYNPTGCYLDQGMIGIYYVVAL